MSSDAVAGAVVCPRQLSGCRAFWKSSRSERSEDRQQLQNMGGRGPRAAMFFFNRSRVISAGMCPEVASVVLSIEIVRVSLVKNSNDG